MTGPQAQHQPEGATALFLDATVATRRGELEAGAVAASGALELFRARGDADGRARAVNLLGAIAFERGALDEAERRFEESLALAHLLHDARLAARASNNLASVIHLRGSPESALPLYHTALLSYQRLGDRRGAAETYHNLNLTFRELGRLDDAEAASAQAVRHAELTGEPGLMSLTVAGQAEVELLRGDLDVAARTIDRANRLAIEAGDRIGLVEVSHLRARLLLRRGDHRAARAEAAGARKAAIEHESALLAAECAAVAALAARADGDAAGAAALRDEARSAFEGLRAVNFSRRFEAAWEA